MRLLKPTKLNPRELFYQLNASYWFVPLSVTAAGATLGIVLLQLEGPAGPARAGWASAWLPSSPAGARALLSAVITSMVTAISVTFSVTIVALTVAAQHFGPRVLNNLVRHTAAQVVLGTFMATFIYSVLVLGAVEGGEENGSVPLLALGGTVGLVVLSIGALIYYVHHIATALQIGELAAEVAEDFKDSVRGLPTDDRFTTSADVPSSDGLEDDGIPEPPSDAAAVRGDQSGYMQRIDYERLVRLAAERDARLWIRREPGAFVLTGAPLGLVAPAHACDSAFADAVRDACVVGRDRTLWNDPEFAVKQLVEMALRALSPGVNEPFTALTCIDRLAEGLAAALVAPPSRWCWVDAQGSPRLFTAPQPFRVLLRAALDPIRLFAGLNPAIYVRIVEVLGELSLVAERAEDLRALREQLEVTRRTAERRLEAEDEEDRRYVINRTQQALRQFEHGPSGTRR